MKFHILLGAASALALATTPVLAQDTNTAASGSDATANSGSQSGAAAQSNPVQTQVQAPINTNAQGQISNSASDSTANSGSVSGSSSDNYNVNAGGNNAGIGNSASNSDSASYSGSISGAESNGNQQGQGQGQDQSQSANNAQDQGQGQDQAQSANNSQSQTANAGSSDQGQMQSSNNTNSLGQQASNQQGVTVNQTWNTTQRKKTIQEFRTNAAVPLAASSSFSSDYCGGTASGGVSAAPIGISIGGAGPTFDKSCQSLRRAEKFGMAAANWHNLGYDERAIAMMRMMEWSICTSDSRGPKGDTSIAEACDRVLAMDGSPPSAPQPRQQEVTPLETQKPNTVPYQYEDLPPKTPRGELEFKATPATPMAAATR